MTCPRCQTINPEGSVSCASCGAPLAAMPPQAAGYPPPGYPPQGGYPPPGYPPPGYGQQPYMMMAPQQQPRTSGMAIAGFVLSFLCALLGLIFSIIGYNEAKKSNGMVKGEGLALAGIIISILSMVLNVVILASSN